MFKWNELPVEILNIIFLYIEEYYEGDSTPQKNNDFAQYALTCRG
jgi:hypothetical protein